MPPAPSGVLHEVQAVFLRNDPGLLLCQKSADGLRGMLEGGIVRIHGHLGEHRGDVHRHTAAVQLLAEPVLQIVADIPLAHGDAHRKRHEIAVDVTAVVFREGLLYKPHLRPVAVGNDHLMPVLDKIRDDAGGVFYSLHLFRQVFSERVASECDDDSHVRPPDHRDLLLLSSV